MVLSGHFWVTVLPDCYINYIEPTGQMVWGGYVSVMWTTVYKVGINDFSLFCYYKIEYGNF